MESVKGVVRVKSFFNAFKMSADEHNFYITTLSQVDFKVKLCHLS